MHRAHLRRPCRIIRVICSTIRARSIVPLLMPLPTGKDSRNLVKTMDTNRFTFKLANLHGFTTKDARVELFFCVREPIKGNNNSLMGWLL